MMMDWGKVLRLDDLEHFFFEGVDFQRERFEVWVKGFFLLP